MDNRGRVALQSNTSPDNFYDEYASTLEVNQPKENTIDYYSFFKRLMDLLITILFLPFACVLILIFSIVIKLETPGPAFFRQERVGLNGRYFNVIKLRSMGIDAEANGAQWAQQNDPRVTKVGKFIRKTRIDELPQLFNVLKGDMSIIGPRPERPIFTAKFSKEIPGFTERLSVKPGLTGWAQVNGGYEITPKEKFKLDMYYIENKGLKIESFIIWKTIKVILTGDGAR